MVLALALLLVGCEIEPSDPDSAAVAPVDANAPVDVNAPVDAKAPVDANAPVAGAFRWDAGRGELALAAPLAGDPLVEEGSDGWLLRRHPGVTGVGGTLDLGGIGTSGFGTGAGYGGGGIGSGGLGVRGTGVGGGGGVAEGLGGIGGLGAKGTGGRAARDTGGGGLGGLVSRQAPATPLRAGWTDDNDGFDDYLAFLATWTDRAGMAGQYTQVDVRDRRFVKVVDAEGRPLPAARVSVLDRTTDEIVWTATTFGDGRAPFYPTLADQAPGGAPEAGWLVQVAHGDAWTAVPWDGSGGELSVALDSAIPEGPVPIDVVFVIDTTGSMSDEIDRIKQTLLGVTAKLRESETPFDLRYGAVLYRDVGDQYVTSTHAFTGDVAAFDASLREIAAGGGGDTPESLNQGLAVAVSGMDWREEGAKVAFVIADAPPHMDYQGDVAYDASAIAAIHHGIRVHTVAASGLDDVGSLVFRQVAQLTRGRFVFIEYGSLAAAAADHGVGGQVSGNNLDAILYDRIAAEIAGFGT